MMFQMHSCEEQGRTKIIATVYGPRQAERDRQARSEGQLFVEMHFAPFCARDFNKEDSACLLIHETSSLPIESSKRGIQHNTTMYQPVIFIQRPSTKSVRNQKSVWCSTIPFCKVLLNLWFSWRALAFGKQSLVLATLLPCRGHPLGQFDVSLHHLDLVHSGDMGKLPSISLCSCWRMMVQY